MAKSSALGRGRFAHPTRCTSPAQCFQIQRPIIKRLRPRQGWRDAGLRPAAVAGVKSELILDILARQRLMGAAAHVGLAFLDDAAVPHDGTDMAGEIVWVWIIRID